MYTLDIDIIFKLAKISKVNFNSNHGFLLLSCGLMGYYLHEENYEAKWDFDYVLVPDD